jgi:hypothetical protein
LAGVAGTAVLGLIVLMALLAFRPDAKEAQASTKGTIGPAFGSGSGADRTTKASSGSLKPTTSTGALASGVPSATGTLSAAPNGAVAGNPNSRTTSATGQRAPAGPAAPAAPKVPGWTMLVNNNYDGVHDGTGTMRCLSTNLQTSTSGAGTHSIYLVPCNPAADGQWWSVTSVDGGAHQLKNRLPGSGGETYCLSGNVTTPPGGFAGTHGAYTAICNTATKGQYWAVHADAGTNTWTIRSNVPVSGVTWELSTTSSSPYSGGGYQVFTAHPGTGSATVGTHIWRLYQP